MEAQAALDNINAVLGNLQGTRHDHDRLTADIVTLQCVINEAKAVEDDDVLVNMDKNQKEHLSGPAA